MKNKLVKTTMLGVGMVKTLTTKATMAYASTQGNLSTYQYQDPSQLQAILHYAAWLTGLLRLGVSAAIGIIFLYGAYKKATDISSSGVADGKKIMWNCTVCMIWAQCGGLFVGFIIHKLESMIS